MRRIRRRIFTCVWPELLFCFMVLVPLISEGVANHPLDGLESSEITATTAILREAGHADDQTLFASITLQEPLKSAVLSWKQGDPIQRKSHAVLRRNGKTFEAVVDLAAKKVSSYQEVRGAQPFVTLPEILLAIRIASEDPQMQE